MTVQTYGDVTAEYQALRNDCAEVDATHDLVWVEGEESAGFLQGLLSQDIEAMGPGDSARSFLLSPQGKLIAHGWVARLEGSVALFCDAGSGRAVAELLDYYRIRVKATVRLDERPVSSLIGPDSDRLAATARSELAVAAPMAGLPRALMVEGLAVEVRRAGGLAYNTIRVEAGEPVMGVDVDEKTIPQETGLVDEAVSFAKGCYLGQELVARIDSRGHVNRHLRGLVVTETVLPPVGASVMAGDRKVGAVSTVGESLSLMAPVGMAMIRREVEIGETVRLDWPGGGAAARVERLPMVQ